MQPSLLRPLRYLMRHPFLRFCVVGTGGFLVDAGLLYALLVLGMGEIEARLYSAAISLVCTWLLHRTYTFQPSGKRREVELMHYAFFNILGFFLNVGFYALLVVHAAMPPMLALVVSCLMALAFNYGVNHYIVFRKAP